MTRGRRRLFFALACAAVGFFLGAALTPTGGARYTERVWGGDLFGMSGFALGALGAGIGLGAGLFLAFKRGWADPREIRSREHPPTSPPSEVPGPRESRRRWLRLKRKRDAPKRFGRRGR